LLAHQPLRFPAFATRVPPLRFTMPKRGSIKRPAAAMLADDGFEAETDAATEADAPQQPAAHEKIYKPIDDMYNIRAYFDTLLSALGWTAKRTDTRITIATGCSGVGLFERLCALFLGRAGRTIAFAAENDPAAALVHHRLCPEAGHIFYDCAGASTPGKRDPPNVMHVHD